MVNFGLDGGLGRFGNKQLGLKPLHLLLKLSSIALQLKVVANAMGQCEKKTVRQPKEIKLESKKEYLKFG